MRYSYDPAKRMLNLARHGLDLCDAQCVIGCSATVTFEDRRFDYGEDRFVTIGPLGNLLVVVVTAEQDEHIRVISMRESTNDEKETYRRGIG